MSLMQGADLVKKVASKMNLNWEFSKFPEADKYEKLHTQSIAFLLRERCLMGIGDP